MAITFALSERNVSSLPDRNCSAGCDLLGIDMDVRDRSISTLIDAPVQNLFRSR